MNRRMAKAKAARKWHAAHQRQVQRFVAGAMARVTDSLVESIRAHATLGETLRDAARAAQGFVVASIAQRVVRRFVADLPRFHSGGPVGLRPGEVPAVILPPGQLYMRERGSSEPMRHVGTTGPITLRLGHDPLPDQRCSCTVERVTKTGSDSQLHQVDVPGPTCDWCKRQPPVPPMPPCGVCGETIRPDGMTGTTCGCAPGRRTWSPLLCECTGTGPTCGYCRGHGVP